MYERKTIIKNLLKKYNKTYISVVENLDREKAGCVSSCSFKVYFDVLGDSILIEDIITKENISVYYEFLKDIDKEKYKDILYIIHANRYKAIKEAMIKDQLIFDTPKGIDCDALHFNRTFTTFKKDTIAYYYDVYYFDIKDTLKPINEYIAEIKKSEQYIALMSKKW